MEIPTDYDDTQFERSIAVVFAVLSLFTLVPWASSPTLGRDADLALELENELEAVLFVHLLAGSDEPELASDRERRLVVR